MLPFLWMPIQIDASDKLVHLDGFVVSPESTIETAGVAQAKYLKQNSDYLREIRYAIENKKEKTRFQTCINAMPMPTAPRITDFLSKTVYNSSMQPSLKAYWMVQFGWVTGNSLQQEFGMVALTTCQSSGPLTPQHFSCINRRQ